MAKLNIYFNKANRDTMTGKLHVIVDDNEQLYRVIEQNTNVAIDLERGTHEVKLYVPFESNGIVHMGLNEMMKGSVMGYTVLNVEMADKDLFYSYKLPLLKNHAGEIVKLNSIEDINKLHKRGKIIDKILLILAVLFILAWLFGWI